MKQHFKPANYILLAFLLLGVVILSAQDATMLAGWTFDRLEQRRAADAVSGVQDTLTGNYRLVEGVQGKAVVVDGYTTCIARPADKVPELGPDFTLEAWIAVGAYPWNWAPIIAQENTESLNSNLDERCWPEDIKVNSDRQGFFFGISPEGYLGLHVGGRGWQICRTNERIPLYEWTHVAATLKSGEKMALYVNGKKAVETTADLRFRPAFEEELRIGMPREKREPSHPVRAFATLPAWYAFDGLLDELHVYNEALSPEHIKKQFESIDPPDQPELPERRMPSGPPGPGTFGASYVHLKYYPEWDNLWPVASHPDIVVQFDNSPIRVVFWRGTRYSPAWVMENGDWMADQGAENFNMRDGCIEHMLDPRCRFSHVRIIENTPARVVVHWRNAPTSANGNFSQVDPVSGWEDWVDEYYTFYPDGIGIRNVIQHTKGHHIWPEEVIALCHPGQRPEDVVDLSAMTLANLNGDSHTYTWAEKTPELRDGERLLHFGDAPEEKPVIMRVNMKSENKPFQIFETTNRFRIFAHEHRKGFSHFPWWNHWPVAQVPSDGRYCQAADRASHFSLAWGGPPAHKGNDDTFWWTWLYGTTKGDVASLVPLARSWLFPPKLKILGSEANGSYDLTQRCYVISGFNNNGDEALRFQLEASADSPMYNAVFVIENWGNKQVVLEMDGKELLTGNGFRFGYIRTLNRYNLVIWLEWKSEKPVEMVLRPERR